MPVEFITYMMSEKNEAKRLQFQLVLQCAPFLKRLKKTCILNVPLSLIRELDMILKDTDMEYHVLAVRRKICLVFFYRRFSFQSYLMEKEIQQFLHQYGYSDFKVNNILQQLSERVCQFSREDIEFPHEIGVFLGYPLEDVRGFIRHKGNQCLLSGYWKVYNNQEKARLTFLAYDKAKTSAVNEYLTGKTIGNIADRI